MSNGAKEGLEIRKVSLFDEDWLSSASAGAPKNSWARDVLMNRNGAGSIYLATLRSWFARFPKASTETKNQLESFVTCDHLGALNEIFWWEWMKRFCWSAKPVSGKKT